MKNIKYSLLYILGLFALNSCTSDLDVQPEDDDIFTADNFYRQPGAYKQALAGVYGNLSLTGPNGAGNSLLQGVDAGTSNYGRCLWYMQTLTTDEAIWTYENDAGVREMQRITWNADNPLVLGMFSRLMVEVALANEYLKQSAPELVASRGISDTEAADIATYREEVRTLRALVYYNLLDLFGKAPMVTENDPVNFQGPEYSAQQLYDFVESELNAVLPNLKPARTNEYGRVDQGVANMILAKLYLNAQIYTGTARYSECAAKCEEIIGAGYTLNANYLFNFNADNQISPEVIFTLQSDGNVTQNYGPTTTMINGQVGSIEQNGVQFGVGAAAWGGAIRLRQQFAEKFNGGDFINDARNTIITAERSPEITNIANPDQGYILGKWSNISSTGVVGPNSTFVNTDFPLFRLADVYLMYAECAARGATGATTSQAVTYVNALRQRAHGGGTQGNINPGELTLDFILDERARELHWEAHRRQDLIRFGRFTGGNYNWAWKGNSANGVSIPGFYSIFPIPTASLASNPNLTQNTGY
ncbi:hypothetical protein AM493_12090 [Flavobacterium akiainvivens]|uniref:RagB/SusD domain-containing protein n=1 Tax=Flavobacterium akiainvivens TaxID=1202724 RepID=A0A0M8MA03_9FLAO|nr:RagB/SusD family nutrient uptake outer membrane protein [Flavobacterium akiainvivens]KOS06693.1 hypothetical protein AM493_12090 [Flavobacterium akiainvivens]SFQ70939.1 Starch-binding associating with outer membrane [Flavobacterium akiainvivens]